MDSRYTIPVARQQPKTESARATNTTTATIPVKTPVAIAAATNNKVHSSYLIFIVTFFAVNILLSPILLLYDDFRMA